MDMYFIQVVTVRYYHNLFRCSNWLVGDPSSWIDQNSKFGEMLG